MCVSICPSDFREIPYPIPGNIFSDFRYIYCTINNTKNFAVWIQTWAMNFPMAILYQMFYCGPLVRLIFRAIFREKKVSAAGLSPDMSVMQESSVE